MPLQATASTAGTLCTSPTGNCNGAGPGKVDPSLFRDYQPRRTVGQPPPPCLPQGGCKQCNHQR